MIATENQYQLPACIPGRQRRRNPEGGGWPWPITLREGGTVVMRLARPASLFEIIAARLWNLLNEGKPFHPIFVIGVFLLYHVRQFTNPLPLLLSVVAALPVLAVYVRYDYPLHLRAFLWLPLVAWVAWAGPPAPGLWLLALLLYFAFTIGLWGSIYYHLRIGTPLNNYRRFWRLVLENSDTTSGNAREQVPKFLLALALMEWAYAAAAAAIGAGPAAAVTTAPRIPGVGQVAAILLAGLAAGVLLLAYSWAVHRWLFTWRPRPQSVTLPSALAGASPRLATPPHPATLPRPATPPHAVTVGAPATLRPLKRAFVVVIDGARRDKLRLAHTPFLDQLAARGTVYTRMETEYPARTVVCFSSMLTGAPPEVHGMRSNLVLSLGVKCESLFERLRTRGRKGILLGCAHLIDAFGADCQSFTAVAHNDRVDHEILDRAWAIIAAENPDLFVVQLISPDQTGHARGVHYPEYLAKLAEADEMIASFYNWLEARGLLEDAAFVVMSDHGQSRGIGGHGHLDEGERYVPFIIAGPGIARGRVVEEPAHIRSLAPTLAMLLGVEPPAQATAPPLLAVLEGIAQPARPEKLTVIFPARNEAATVGDLVRRVPRSFLPGLTVEVLVVDDGSTDGTGEVARAAGADRIVCWEQGRGLGAAVREGLRAAYAGGADYAIFMDADGEYPPEEIPEVIAPLRLDQADYVVGSRFRGYIHRMRPVRRLGNWTFTLLQSLLLRRWITDGQSGMRALNRRALAAFDINHDYNYAQVLTLNLIRQGFRYQEVPITYASRPSGRSFVRLGPYIRHVVPAVWRELRRFQGLSRPSCPSRPSQPAPVSTDTAAD